MTVLQAVLEPQSLTPVLRRELPTGCICSTGLSDLKLPLDFYRLGAHAFDNGKLLSHVDISETTVTEIREFTFAHCVLLQRVMLPYTLHTIHSNAFMNCAALQELAITSLHCLQGLPRLYSLAKAYASARQKNYMERDLCRRNCLCALSSMASATVAPSHSRSRIRVGLWPESTSTML